MSKPIRKAVFPVAGLGTRFLPATKAMPKEMLAVVDRPVIQRVVDEAVEAGIEQLIFVTGRNKGVIEDHFDVQPELMQTLRDRNKTGPLEILEAELPEAGTVTFTRQQKPLGLGHAVWCAREIVGNEPFALILPDVIVKSEGKGCMSQMIDMYNETGGNVIAVEQVAPELTSNYGIVSLGGEVKGARQITGMVEKPKVEDAPSNLIIMGRYILQPEIFELLEAQETGAGGEIQITDSMLKLLTTQNFFACEYQGQSYDCGSKIGFLMANVVFGLDNPEVGEEFRKELKALL
ncbi:MAG: UTP--glucose-1-phosphate uridylyltransferase GalU [Methyloligellaceae bacterium]